ncbi:MAG: D-2-hydroxyacid dehydrogenase [Nitrososphaerales archaeon]|nr:D-2-hydroxyacid dehydrogenase [Nitrososphaerales archaeon]
MSKTKILVCDSISEKAVNLLKDTGFEVSYLPSITPEDLLLTIPNYDVVIIRSRTEITQELISAGKKLKIIGRAGVGLDNIDLKAAEEADVEVYNTPDSVTNSVAELILGMMLSLSRGICIGNSSLKEGNWMKSHLKGFELKDKVLGVIGLGRIGTRLSELVQAIGMNILFYDIVEAPKETIEKLNLKYAEIDDILTKSDYITLNIPLTQETKHFISGEKISKMKKTAYLINASRGAVVDEKALLDALKNDRIKGAALDVFENEPPGRNKLVVMSNVVCTPHIGAQTVEAQEAAAIEVSKRIIEFFRFVG